MSLKAKNVWKYGVECKAEVQKPRMCLGCSQGVAGCSVVHYASCIMKWIIIQRKTVQQCSFYLQTFVKEKRSFKFGIGMGCHLCNKMVCVISDLLDIPQSWYYWLVEAF